MKYRLNVFKNPVFPTEILDAYDSDDVHMINNFESFIELADTDLLENLAHAIIWQMGYANNVIWALYYQRHDGTFNYIMGS